MRQVFIGAAVAAFVAAFPFSISGQRPTPASPASTRVAEGRPSPARAAEGMQVTFSKDVAPIVYNNCAFCHRPGEVAPFSLMTYRDARPWARAIKQQVEQRLMPPWNADPHFGEFSNARRLTDKEIATITAWVDSGAPEGNPTDLPAAPKFVDGWQIGEPDLVLTMKEPVPIQATGTIPYATYPADYEFPEDTWVQAIEIRPGNRRVVHHAVAEAEIPGQPGSQNVHLYSPGLDAMMWREGYGKFFPKGTRIGFNMHYNAIGKETTDLTKVGFKFAKTPVHTQVNTTIVVNNTFAIPPMVQNHEIVGAFQFPTEARIHGLRPHMHLRARLGTASLITPDGNRRVLLHVPRWDDAWQNYYVLAKPARVAKGSILEYLGDYDNSPANALNPDPKATVPWGQQVWDEMHSVYMTWTAINEQNKNDDAPIQIPADRQFTTGSR